MGVILRSFKRVERLVRYGAVGTALALLNTLLTWSLVQLSVIDNPVAATAIATATIQPFAYFAHRAFTYPDAVVTGRSILRFIVITCTTAGLATLLMQGVVLAGLPYWVALVLGWGVIPVANFLIGAFWIFGVSSVLRVSGRRGF